MSLMNKVFLESFPREHPVIEKATEGAFALSRLLKVCLPASDERNERRLSSRFAVKKDERESRFPSPRTKVWDKRSNGLQLISFAHHENERQRKPKEYLRASQINLIIPIPTMHSLLYNVLGAHRKVLFLTEAIEIYPQLVNRPTALLPFQLPW